MTALQNLSLDFEADVQRVGSSLHPASADAKASLLDRWSRALFLKLLFKICQLNVVITLITFILCGNRRCNAQSLPVGKASLPVPFRDWEGREVTEDRIRRARTQAANSAAPSARLTLVCKHWVPPSRASCSC